MRRFLFYSIFCIPLTIILMFLGTPISADQNDPRLEILFENLKTSVSVKNISTIETQIWEIWMDHLNPEAKRSMFLGIESMNNQKYMKALEHFRLLTEIEPDFAEGWNKRSTVLYLMGRLKESEEHDLRTVKLEPRHFGAYSGLGLIRMVLGEWIGSITALETALRFNPHMSGVIKNLNYIRKKKIGSMT
jgi:tetratricopeptide (TPR) repeat protein